MLKLDNNRSGWLLTLTKLTNPEAEDIRLPIDLKSYLPGFLDIENLPDLINKEIIKSVPEDDTVTRLALSNFETLQDSVLNIGLNAFLNLSMPDCKESESKELAYKETFKALLETTELLWGYIYTCDSENITLDRVIKFQEDTLPEEFWEEELIRSEGSLPLEEGKYLVLMFKINSMVGVVNTTFFCIIVPYS